MKTPCEVIVWSVVPIIKKEFAKSLINDHGLNQKETAYKLITTEAAISRYISGKRGALEITDESIIKEIKKSTKQIAKENGPTVIRETCRICNLLRSKDFVEGINYSCG